jgi:hypothetical protein
MAQKRQAFESVTLGHIRSHGCRDLLIYLRCLRPADEGRPAMLAGDK